MRMRGSVGLLSVDAIDRNWMYEFFLSFEQAFH